MERLPPIDVHTTDVAADVEATWRALVHVAHRALGGSGHEHGPRERFVRVLRPDPPGASGAWSPDLQPGTALRGFGVERVRRAELLSLRGRHRFARYRLDFELAGAGPGRSRLHARTWAEFPGLRGAAYRALVIRSGAHARIVRGILRQVADAAQAR